MLPGLAFCLSGTGVYMIPELAACQAQGIIMVNVPIV
jgi:hypothetical protein